MPRARVYLTTLSLIALAAVGLQSLSSSAPHEGVRYMRVVDAETAEPLCLCYLIVLRTKCGTITDSTGMARLRCLDGGKWLVKLVRYGYFDTSMTVNSGAWREDTLRWGMRRQLSHVMPCDSLRKLLYEGAD